ncbi:MAG: hypothetical protein QHJ73_06645, partial [Armatimonadota bacterium]|nr:hypothetical protein [Armatimonadota bacterium]
TARHVDSLDGRCVANGRLDLNAALTRRLVPPIAEAGNDTATPPGVPVVLDASASQPYPGRNLASFVWSENGKVLQRSRRPTYTFRSEVIGTHRVDLQVVDNEFQSGHDGVRVQVAERVMSGTEMLLAQQDAQTLRAVLTVRDVVTGDPVEKASATLLLAVPGPILFRATGETNRQGQFHAEWRMPFRLPRGTYEARLQELTHPLLAWDRRQTAGTFRR